MKLQIEKMMYGGSGLAHPIEVETAKAVFVPFTLPGELVEAQLTEQKLNFGEASLLQVLSPSPDRVIPNCSHFGDCGGCQYQHAAYPAQVKMKESILRDTLEHVGLKTLPEIQSHTSEPWHHRNRTRLRIAEMESATRVGYNRRGTNQFLPICECPILSPILWRAAESFLQIANENSPSGRWARNVVEVELFTSDNEKKLQMTLFVRKNQPGLAALCERLKELVPELAGAGTSLLAAAGPKRQKLNPRPQESWGATGLSYHAAEADYWVSRGGFFQVNRYLIDELVEIVVANRQGLLAWDLYAGVGLFSRTLTKTFQQVVAVEANGNDLISTFKGPGRHAIEATTLEFLQQAGVQRERPQLIVMDPPRAGVGPEVCSLLARLSTPEIVYVSCDPVTLARDLKLLVDAGYGIVELHMVDLFPQTFHLETVVILRR